MTGSEFKPSTEYPSACAEGCFICQSRGSFGLTGGMRTHHPRLHHTMSLRKCPGWLPCRGGTCTAFGRSPGRSQAAVNSVVNIARPQHASDHQAAATSLWSPLYGSYYLYPDQTRFAHPAPFLSACPGTTGKSLAKPAAFSAVTRDPQVLAPSCESADLPAVLAAPCTSPCSACCWLPRYYCGPRELQEIAARSPPRGPVRRS